MKLTPEQLKMNAAAMVAFAEGKPILSRIRETEHTAWLEWNMVSEPAWNFAVCEYMPKPELRPWDFNNRPNSIVWVYRKGYITDCMIVAWGDDVVVIATKHGLLNQSYDALLKDWLRRDGTPCGVTEEPC